MQVAPAGNDQPLAELGAEEPRSESLSPKPDIKPSQSLRPSSSKGVLVTTVAGAKVR